VQRLPKTLTRRFQVMVLADTAFGSVEFLQGIRKLRYHGVVGVRCDRKLVDGRKVSSLYFSRVRSPMAPAKLIARSGQ
jgi:hypothetical protein